ncbi:MAG: glycogen debranching enzyme N-terminal domain-containing protein, partial [Candidatus Bathyarchaeia archaeon]
MKLPTISLTDGELAHFDEAIQKEWLITNGLGGYAASTVLGLNTRKYHGLLVASLHPPRDRTVCLAKLDEVLQVGNTVQQLGVNEFHDAIHPQGYLFLKQFSVSPFPEYNYVVHAVEVKKTIFMPKEKNAVAVIYQVLNNNNEAVTFRLFPLLTCRHIHSVGHKTSMIFSQQQEKNKVTVGFDVPKVTIAAQTTIGKFIEKPVWIERLYYREEANRGESHLDDCYQPGYFELELPHGLSTEFAIVTVTSENSQECATMLETLGNSITSVKAQLTSEIKWRERLLAKFYDWHKNVTASDWLNCLILAADTFVVKGSDSKISVLAGYFWFETWGRDTFVSLPGLLLVTGRFDDARDILLNFMAYSKRGLIPNYVDDRCGKAVYNTVDATLWYVNAVWQFLKYTGDFKFVQRQLWEGLKQIVAYYERGTDFGIHVDSDGLLAHESRLTWMDA